MLKLRDSKIAGMHLALPALICSVQIDKIMLYRKSEEKRQEENKLKLFLAGKI